jgi:hypothetical protein
LCDRRLPGALGERPPAANVDDSDDPHRAGAQPLEGRVPRELPQTDDDQVDFGRRGKLWNLHERVRKHGAESPRMANFQRRARGFRGMRRRGRPLWKHDRLKAEALLQVMQAPPLSGAQALHVDQQRVHT